VRHVKRYTIVPISQTAQVVETITIQKAKMVAFSINAILATKRNSPNVRTVTEVHWLNILYASHAL